MTQRHISQPSYVYWRGTKRDTTRAVLPNFVADLPATICNGHLRAKLAAAAGFGRGNVVVIDSWGKDALLLSIAKAAFGFRLVVRLRGDPLATIRSGGRLSAAAKAVVSRFILDRADLLVFNSQYLRARPSYAKYAAKSEVVYNPLMYTHSVAPSETPPRPTCLRVLSVMSFGWMEKIRPLGVAITEWVDADFLARENITWTICGVGTDTDAYHWFIDRLAETGRGGRIEFVGQQNDMPALYAAHDVLAHLSGLEAFPNAVLEASYYELPTITNPESGGTLEAVEDGVTGAIVADGAAFREALLRYAGDHARRREHGAGARARVIGTFSIESQKAAMATLLRKRFG